MSDTTDPRDPFDSLATPAEELEPRPEFARRLRRTLSVALGLPAEVPFVDLPGRTTTMSTTTHTAASGAAASGVLVPYLTVDDGAAAVEFYRAAFGAEPTLRFDGPDGSIGHAELVAGPLRFFLSDEAPELGVLSPRTLGGTSVGMHLAVEDVDASVARAEAAGATVRRPPEDMFYGQRQGVVVDPFGHRWLLTQRLESVGVADLAERMGDEGYRISGRWVDDPHDERPRAEVVARNGRVWPAVLCANAPAMIRLAVDVLGFTEQIVVPGERPDEIVHSQMAWPEGGVVQFGSADRGDGNPFSQRPVGSASIYVVTDDPMAVYHRCVAAGLEIVREPETPDYDPGGSGFGLRDPEGNLWSFGTYPGE